MCVCVCYPGWYWFTSPPPHPLLCVFVCGTPYDSAVLRLAGMARVLEGTLVLLVLFVCFYLCVCLLVSESSCVV